MQMRYGTTVLFELTVLRIQGEGGQASGLCGSATSLGESASAPSSAAMLWQRLAGLGLVCLFLKRLPLQSCVIIQKQSSHLILQHVFPRIESGVTVVPNSAGRSNQRQTME